MDYASWADVLDVNTMGPMRVTEAFVDHVGRSERKIIVTITSGMGSLADNSSGGWIAYRSSKAGVNMVMRTVALDLKSRGVICVLLNPGWVKTDMGGPNANLTVESSVSNMRSVIDKTHAGGHRQVLSSQGERISLVSPRPGRSFAAGGRGGLVEP